MFGSNDEQEKNIESAKDVLSALFPDAVFSSSIWTEPIGVETEKYLNCMCVVHTAHGKAQVLRALKHAENKLGSTTAERNRNKVRIDLDLMMFDEERLHLNDWNRPYVKQLFDEMKAQGNV